MQRTAFGLLCLAAASFGFDVIAEPAEPSATGALVAHMHEHYDAVKKVQEAIIRGDLEGTREPARWLAETPVPAEMPAQWDANVESMRAAARSALTAGDLDSAASAAARMAHACGTCHVDHGVTGLFARQRPPDDEPGQAAHMQRHQWAADRMWEGILGPSNVAWSLGTDLLLEVPLAARELDEQDSDPRSVRSMAHRIHQLAGNGMMEQDPNARVEIYAEFLAICAACHRKLGQGPAAD